MNIKKLRQIIREEISKLNEGPTMTKDMGYYEVRVYASNMVQVEISDIVKFKKNIDLVKRGRVQMGTWGWGYEFWPKNKKELQQVLKLLKVAR